MCVRPCVSERRAPVHRPTRNPVCVRACVRACACARACVRARARGFVCLGNAPTARTMSLKRCRLPSCVALILLKVSSMNVSIACRAYASEPCLSLAIAFFDPATSGSPPAFARGPDVLGWSLSRCWSIALDWPSARPACTLPSFPVACPFSNAWTSDSPISRELLEPSSPSSHPPLEEEGGCWTCGLETSASTSGAN